MPGPPPTPIELKLLRGNPGRRPVPSTLRVLPPPEPPSPPDHLSEYALEEWRRVAPELHACRLLTPLDLMPFAAYCEAFSVWRTALDVIETMAANDPLTHGLMVKTPDGASISPVVRIARQAAREMLRFAEEFGMTPSARARIAAGVPAAFASEFDGLLGRR
jgi:P27 family predicted phage terminase small subunit